MLDLYGLYNDFNNTKSKCMELKEECKYYDTNTLINSTRHVEIGFAIVSNVTIESASLNQQFSTNKPLHSRRNCRSSSARTRRN
ncbi:unnamed protein product [Rotaria magnacalcarata]|uniref:Uncharacterized protein n=2 Tax=Rotaria magnacalcarata TaxID=392030 RepID=A0A815YJJ9_9BILA|nr:unnamed protein product [Rotaria magnacalcarata]CAF5192925.1 unnamed protein product [Rotaria magnacalcarata]